MRAVFFDLDNTLYDWVRYFARAFTVMAAEVSRHSGLPHDVVMAEAKDVFRLHGTVEYGFWIQELPSLQALHPGVRGHDLARQYWPSIEAFKKVRRELLHPYPGVDEGLSTIRRSGIRTIALTDATHWHANHRLHALGLTQQFDWLVARPDVAVPHHTDLEKVSGGQLPPRPPAPFHGLRTNLRKPDPNILRDTCAAMGVDVSETAVVGDNLVKDIAMAQAAGAVDVWAAYGVPSVEDLDVVVGVSNWSPEQIRSEADPAQEPTVVPSHTARSFDDVTTLVTGS